ncbi:MAG TPA: AIM24 family protein, partial [Phycisphaerae bacterium]|nr:AIM24 family protein [Phycisphaerae bacterium]
MIEWYYAKGNQQLGPVTTQELQAMAADGRLSPEDLVWKEGLADWTPAGRVQGLFRKNASRALAAAPPPSIGQLGRARPVGAPRCHEITYEIHGDDMQVVEVELDPGETVIAEAGAMNYMDDGITFEAKMGDGSKPDAGVLGKLFDGAKRVITGESLFITHFTNQSNSPKRVAFAAPYPGKVIAMDLGRAGGEVLCQKDGFLCAAYGTEVGIAFARRLGAGFFGGEGFILQRLRGDGM